VPATATPDYIALVKRTDTGGASHIPFIVPMMRPKADLLFRPIGHYVAGLQPSTAAIAV